MDRLGSGAAGGIDDARDVQVGLARIARTERNHLIEETRSVGLHIILGGRKHRTDPHLAAAARDANRDFAAIRDQNGTNQPASQGAFCLLRNAVIPPCPSFETRLAAMASMVYGIESLFPWEATQAIS